MDLLDFCFRNLFPYIGLAMLIISFLMIRKIKERIIHIEQLKADVGLLWIEFVKNKKGK